MTKQTIPLLLEVECTDVQGIQQVNFTADAEKAFTNFREGRYLQESKHLAVRVPVGGSDDQVAKDGAADVRSRDMRNGTAMESPMGDPRHSNTMDATKPASATKKSNELQPFLEIYPGGILNNELFDERTEAIIGRYSMRLLRTGAFLQHEQGDVTQEFRIQIATKMSKYDPEQSNRYTFAGIIVDGVYKNMLRTRDRELSRSHGFLSLQDCPGGCDEALGEFLAVDDYIDMTTGGMIPSARKADFYEALQVFLESRDELDRRICKAIATYGSAEQASKHIGIPARTILHHLRNSILEKAVEAGLDEILGGAR